MYIDPRVAHGRAKFDLGKDDSLFRINRALAVADVIMEALCAASSCATRRERARMLQKKAVPALRRLGIAASTKTGKPLIAVFVSHDPVEGLRQIVAHVDTEITSCDYETMTAITPHAVARCLQRNGIQTLDAIEGDLLRALHVASGIRSLAWDEGWRQIGIPCRKGLFVGTVEGKNRFHLKTYLKPGANGRDSRWSNYQSLFEGMPEFGGDKVRRAVDTIEWMKMRAEESAAAGPVCRRFPFLTQPYEATDDSLDARWDAARSAAELGLGAA